MQSVSSHQPVRQSTRAARGAQPVPSPVPSALTEKQITLRTLSALKQRLYARAAVAMQHQPEKAEVIQKRVNSDAQHIAFVINMVSIKL